ncbi:hypothetical protein [Paragemmobacter ruber]|uniref:Sulfotransferase family protein n=1 Tax=Paragemmobacter ruber TaxID=1985673 RepID=A0ABW9Y2S0_9RHOB|nr:hypothetical protein [Rhodobacter ruber]NBE06431.1 hypothetical protein [Rhodobacter ruber]
MRVICHIGHHKTGTTTLQAFLSQNFAALIKAGTLYPWTESEGAALALSQTLHPAGWSRPLLPINFREAHNALAFRMLADTLPKWKVPPYHRMLPHSRQMLLSVRNQINTLAPSTVVLCSEVMSHFGLVAPEQITRLRDEAFPDAKDIRLWCTLRRPDEQLVSWHGQQVRFGQSPPPLSDVERGLKLDSLHVDYRGVIEPWLQRLGGATPVLRPYRETLAEGGSVEDFLRHSGATVPRGLASAPTLNISRKPGIVLLLRQANAALPAPLAQELADWLDGKGANLTLASTSDVEFLGPDARHRLAERFRPIHDWLSEVTGRPAFFTDLDRMTACNPMSEDAALRQLLDQLRPSFTDDIRSPQIRDFLKGLRHAA